MGKGRATDLAKEIKQTKSLKRFLKSKSGSNPASVVGNAEVLSKQPVYSIRQLCYPSSTTMSVSGTGVTWTPSSGLLNGTTSTAFWSLYFRLADFPQSSSTFGGLVDQYRIPKVRVHFYPSLIAPGTAAVTNAPVFTVVDYDDSSALSAVTDIFQYQNVQIHSPYKPFTVSLKPRIAVPSGTGFVNEQAGWLDMADQTVMHYGLKGVFPWASATTVFVIIVEADIQLRSVR